MRFIVVATALGLALAGPAAARECDAACVTETADAAFAALLSGAPGKAIPRGARITENGRDIRPADSQLFAVRRITYRHAFAQPAAGAAGIVGAAEAAGGPAIFAVRLKLKGDRVTEIETIVTRRTEAALFAPQAMVAQSGWDAVLAAEQRTAPEAMLAAVDAWLDGLEAGDVARAPIAAACSRQENGVELACRTPASPIDSVRDRRIPLIDEARGLVWALAVLDVPGDGRRKPRGRLAAQLFKLDAGRIVGIEAVLRDAPRGASAGWAPPKPQKTKKGP